MKAQPFTDAVLGEFKPDKKNSSKTHLCFSREATITLHEIHAQDYIDVSAGNKQQLIWGKVTLVERKMVDKNTSASSLFREVRKTPESVTRDKII
jgi:hypothetical protein